MIQYIEIVLLYISKCSKQKALLFFVSKYILYWRELNKVKVSQTHNKLLVMYARIRKDISGQIWFSDKVNLS